MLRSMQALLKSHLTLRPGGPMPLSSSAASPAPPTPLSHVFRFTRVFVHTLPQRRYECFEPTPTALCFVYTAFIWAAMLPAL